MSGRGMSLDRRWTVSADEARSYEVRAVDSLWGDHDALLAGGRVPGRRFVVVDSGVVGPSRVRLRDYLTRPGLTSEFMTVPGGERYKTMDTAVAIIERMRQFGLDRRNEPVILIGGGAVLDTGGFAASVYRRGVPYIRVPTTVLAYVDAAIGIKTGVNLGTSKNLVGTFRPPDLVLLDREFFASLPPREIANGLGEVLKLGLGCDAELFGMLEEAAPMVASTRLRDVRGFAMLTRAVDTMLRQLSGDLYERDLCRTTDLGHTFSPAFEMSGGVGSVRHGEAVAFDLNLSAIVAARRALLAVADLRRLAALTGRLGLPTTVPDIDPRALWDSLAERTLHRAGRQRVPLPDRIGGCVFVNDLSRREVDHALKVLRTDHFYRDDAHRSDHKPEDEYA